MTAPLVLIPGISSDATAWAGMPAGEVMVSGADTIDGMAADILARAPDRFALAGHSMGGYVALAMIAQAPQRIDRLALLSTSAAADDPAQRAARAGLIDAAGQDFAGVSALLLRAMLHPDARSNAALAAELSAMIAAIGADTFLRQQRATLARPDRTGLLAAIAVPTLVLTGEDDRVVAPARSSEMAAAIPAARLLTIPRCGHVPQREAPSATAAALAAWLCGPA